MTKRTLGKINRARGRSPIEVEQEVTEHDEVGQSPSGTIELWQDSDLILMEPEEASQLAALLQRATGEHPPAPPAPEPLRRFPALYERLRVYDEKTKDFLGLCRYVTEVGACDVRSEGRAYVRLDGDGSSESDADGVFLWDEDARAFYFKGGDHLYLIPVDYFEED